MLKLSVKLIFYFSLIFQYNNVQNLVHNVALGHTSLCQSFINVEAALGLALAC